MTDKKTLVDSKEFDEAIVSAAELKKDMVTSYKQQHKANYERFYETMLNSRKDIQQILSVRKKNRSDADKELLKKFKQNVSRTYSQVRDFMLPEVPEEGKQTKIEKIVEKIAVSINMLRYVDSDVLDKVFEKAGLVVTSQSELQEYFDSTDVKENVKDIFNSAVSLKTKMNRDNDTINKDIYLSKVPVELQYDKKMNNSGLKPSDFRKLVDMKAKLVMAKTDEAKEKVDEKIEKAATDKQFEVARAELVRDKLTKLQ